MATWGRCRFPPPTIRKCGRISLGPVVLDRPVDNAKTAAGRNPKDHAKIALLGASAVSSEARDLFLAVVDQPPEQRERLLEQLRFENPELQARVLKLLEAHENQGPLDRGIGPAATQAIREAREAGPGAVAAGTVLGEYQILGEIGSGGSGVVYRARHLRLNRIVALKFLRVGEFATKREVERFRAEAEAAARLDHPNIVPVFEVGELQGRHYFSMKLIEGGSLASVPSTLSDDPRRAAALILTTARAVHHAHQRGVLHRDLKPSNILLDEQGVPHVADFGIAKRLDAGESMTMSGWICGTPAYMAPEQINPALGEVTVQTDVYAMGCILYQALAGRPPFEGETAADLFRKALDQAPAAPSSVKPGVPRDLETICLKCLDKSAERRYPSLAAMADDLELWLAHRPIQARKSSLPEKLWLAWRRKPVVFSLAAAVTLLVLVLAVGASVASLLLRENLDRARRAEVEARNRLRTSLIAQSRAHRKSQSVGRREESLRLLIQAAAIQPGGEILNEAVSAFALTDLRLFRSWPRPSETTAPAFSPRFERFAIGFPGGRIEVRSVRSGTLEREFPGFGLPILQFEFSHDGRRLAVKYHDSEQGRVKVWDLESGEALLDEAVVVYGGSLEFGPDGGLAVGDPEGVLRLFDLEAGGPERRIQLPAPVARIAWHPEGRTLAVAFREGKVAVLDAANGRRLWGVRVSGPVLALAWSMDGQLLGFSSGKFLHIRDARDWREIRRIEGHNAEVVRVFFLPAKPLVATFSWDGTSRVWNAVTGESLIISPAQVAGFSDDGHYLGFSTREAVSAWEVLHDDLLWTLHGHTEKSPTALDISPDDRWLASSGSDGALLWDLKERRQATVLTKEATGGAVFHPSGKEVYVCTAGGLFRWGLPDDRAARRLSPQPLVDGMCGRVAMAASGSLMAFTHWEPGQPDSATPAIVLMDPRDGRVIRRLPGAPGTDRIDLSPSGDLVALGNWHGDGVHVLDTGDGTERAALCQGAISARAVFSPNGRWLVTTTGAKTQVWEVGSWKEVQTIARPEGASNLAGMAAFTRDSSRLAVTPTTRSLELVDPGTWKTVVVLEAPTPINLSDVRFSSSGDRLAAASPTSQIQIWELRRIQENLRELDLSGPEALLASKSHSTKR